MATILSGLLVEEVDWELLDEIPLPVILPVILYDADELLLLELSFLAHEMMVRLKHKIRKMNKIFFNINLLGKTVNIF
jgi:hypothetical protein